MIKLLLSRYNTSFTFSDYIYSYISFFKQLEDTRNIKSLFGLDSTTYISFTNYARSGIKLLLQSFSLPAGSQIGVQVYTCKTVLEAIVNAGYTVVFIDINNNYGIDTADLIKKRHQIDLLIVTHTFGIPADINKIAEIMIDKPVIEDCAHSLFTKYNNRQVGTFFDASVFSYGYSKMPSIGQGGMVWINNTTILKKYEEEYRKIKKVSVFEELININKNLLFSIGNNKIVYGTIVYNLHKYLGNKVDFTNKNNCICGKAYQSNVNVLIRKLTNYQNIINKNMEIQNELLSQIDKSNQSINYVKSNNAFVLPVRIKNRIKKIQQFWENNIDVGSLFSNCIRISKNYNYIKGSCPNAEQIADEIITIPLKKELNLKITVKILTE